jgi:hypothetical protein
MLSYDIDLPEAANALKHPSLTNLIEAIGPKGFSLTLAHLSEAEYFLRTMSHGTGPPEANLLETKASNLRLSQRENSTIFNLQYINDLPEHLFAGYPTFGMAQGMNSRRHLYTPSKWSSALGITSNNQPLVETNRAETPYSRDQETYEQSPLKYDTAIALAALKGILHASLMVPDMDQLPRSDKARKTDEPDTIKGRLRALKGVEALLETHLGLAYAEGSPEMDRKIYKSSLDGYAKTVADSVYRHLLWNRNSATRLVKTNTVKAHLAAVRAKIMARGSTQIDSAQDSEYIKISGHDSMSSLLHAQKTLKDNMYTVFREAENLLKSPVPVYPGQVNVKVGREKVQNFMATQTYSYHEGQLSSSSNNLLASYTELVDAIVRLDSHTDSFGKHLEQHSYMPPVALGSPIGSSGLSDEEQAILKKSTAEIGDQDIKRLNDIFKARGIVGANKHPPQDRSLYNAPVEPKTTFKRKFNT